MKGPQGFGSSYILGFWISDEVVMRYVDEELPWFLRIPVRAVVLLSPVFRRRMEETLARRDGTSRGRPGGAVLMSRDIFEWRGIDLHVNGPDLVHTRYVVGWHLHFCVGGAK